MKESSIITTTYELGNCWMIDITEYKGSRETWLYHLSIGIKTFMFGRRIEDDKYPDYLEMVEVNVEEYKDDYVDEYFDYEERKEYYARKKNYHVSH